VASHRHLGPAEVLAGLEGSREGQAKALELVRGLAAVRRLLDDEIGEAVVHACWDNGVDASSVAAALGVSRSALYRRYLTPAHPSREV
jgi:transcriptional regulator of acetoin/glycerol metabolism